jgi:hypothetical protein
LARGHPFSSDLRAYEKFLTLRLRINSIPEVNYEINKNEKKRFDFCCDK